MISQVLSAIGAVFIVLGSLFCFLAALGIARLPDLLTRMHAASKAGTMGAGLAFIGVALCALDMPVVFRALVGVGFLVLTTPLSAHLLARAALRSGHKSATTALPDEWRRETNHIQ